MGVERVEQSNDKYVIHIHEPTRFGFPDKWRQCEVTRESFLNLPMIFQEEIDELPNYGLEHEEAEFLKLPQIGTLVFIRDYDEEGGWGYRLGAHNIFGPYRLVEGSQ